MSSQLHRPLWGNFVAYADVDLLAFGLLVHSGLMVPGFYHGVQAIEKYLKALVLSTLDSEGTQETPQTRKWLLTHDLEKLATKCSNTHDFYSKSNATSDLRRLTEFDQATRYPWVNRSLGNGFTSEDILVIAGLCKQLRNDLPIVMDNYKLGMEARGYFHGDRSKLDPARDHYSHEAVLALRIVVPTLDDFVRGWDPLQFSG